MNCCRVVVLPAALALHVPQNSSAACAVDTRPVDWLPNRISWLFVARTPVATTDMRRYPLVFSVSPALPTALAEMTASSHQTQVVAAVGASVGHGVASVVPSVPTVGSQPRTNWNVAAEVVAMVPDAVRRSARPMPFGFPEKKFAGTIAGAPVVGWENTACVV